MNTLTGIEADRVDMIMKHVLDRLHIISHVPSTWDDSILSELNCQAVATALEKTWQAEEALKALEESDGLVGGKDIALIKVAAKATRATCRNLQADRESLQILMSRPEVQSEDMVKFIKYLSELTAQVHTRMTTTVEDEAANRALLRDLTERERLMEETRDVLQVKLTEVREEKDRVSFSLDQKLRRLQLELQDITEHNQLELETVQREMAAAIAKATSDHELRMRQLQGTVDSTERTYAELVERNREEEQRMRKEKNRAESALNAKITQYDEDMSARHKILNEMRLDFKRDSEEYAVLKEHFDRMDADTTKAKEEDFILSAVRRRANLGLRIMDDAATLIQKIARGRIGRAIVNKMKPKGKGAKGKKAK